MEKANNTLPEIIQVQSSAANRKPNAKAPNAADDNSFRQLMEARQTVNKKDCGSKQTASSALSENPQNAAENPLAVDDTDVNRQMMIAEMLAGQMPAVVQPDMQLEVPADVDGLNVEEVGEVLIPQTLGEEAKLPAEELQPQTEQLLNNEAKVSAKPEGMQSAAEAKQPVDEFVAEKAKPEAAAVTDEPKKEAQKDTVKVEQNPDAEAPLFRKADTVMIRVGDAAKAEKGTGTDVPQQLTKQLSGPIREKVSSVELELNPKSLGKVHVELEWLQDGSLHVSIKAEKLGTQHLLENSAGVLQHSLEQDAEHPVQVEVQQHQEELPDYEQDQQQQERQNSRQNQNQQEDAGNRFLQELRLGLTTIDG